MNANQDAALTQTVESVAAKARRFQDRRLGEQNAKGLGEQNTKASLIEPILEALGWDIRDPDEVHREFKPTTRDSPVDYALKLLRKPRLFVEAKGLGENLSDRKWVSQMLGYATMAGVEWCVLTNGNEYRVYNASAPVEAEEKLFRSVRLVESDTAEAVDLLRLISRANMEENLLDVLWSAHFVDRRVKEALGQMLDSVDKALVRLIRRRVPKLSPKEIAESIRRLDVAISQSNAPPATPTRRAQEWTPQKSRAPRKQLAKTGVERTKPRAGKKKLFIGVTLKDVIDAGLLNPPLKLTRKYHDQLLEAELKRDGTVVFQGKAYSSCSTAADEARRTIIGGTPHTNGWSFWCWNGGDGKSVPLDEARQALLKRRT
ncbi:MAG: hypothetical protein AB7U73_17275 [Pirellulales bacterium]